MSHASSLKVDVLGCLACGLSSKLLEYKLIRNQLDNCSSAVHKGVPLCDLLGSSFASVNQVFCFPLFASYLQPYLVHLVAFLGGHAGRHSYMTLIYKKTSYDSRQNENKCKPTNKRPLWQEEKEVWAFHGETIRFQRKLERNVTIYDA